MALRLTVFPVPTLSTARSLASSSASEAGIEFPRSPQAGTYVFLMESTKFSSGNFTHTGNAFEHSTPAPAGAVSPVAGLSGAMMRSCLAAPSVRAEQWSRSAERQQRARPADLSAWWSCSVDSRPPAAPPAGPHSDPPSAHTMESGRSSGNGGEFPVCYNKMESSILVTEGIGHSWSTPRIHHFVHL